MTEARANIEALRTLRALQADDRPATPDEQGVLARWSGWGALPEAFDESHPAWAWARDALGGLLLDATELAAAARSTINAHYTSAEVVTEAWRAVAALGFTGGRVLEPGCGPSSGGATRAGGTSRRQRPTWRCLSPCCAPRWWSGGAAARTGLAAPGVSTMC